MTARDKYTVAFALFYTSLLIGTAALLVHGFVIGSMGGKQIGLLALAATLLYTPVWFVAPQKRSAVIQKSARLTAGVAVAGVISVACGELMLRLLYWEGTSFSSHGGPLVKRFERNFKFNRFDGPSRGPETADSKRPETIRILVQGDSITWGQGIQDEDDLFTTRLLHHFLDAGVRMDMAVLARPGREIDGHLEQLQKWGRQLNPDVIIYQWYINDMELDHSARPSSSSQRFWHINLIHQPLATNSYLYFFLYYSLGVLLPSTTPVMSYNDYLIDHFSEHSAAWNEFADVFTDWATLAKGLTPRVLVAIYPHMIFPPGDHPRMDPDIADLQNRFRALCVRQGIVTVSLFESLKTFDDARDVRATTFDGHPSVAAHRAIANALETALVESWPVLFSESMRLPSDRKL